MALHGQWLGIDLADRMVLAETLFASTGGQGRPFIAPVDAILDERLARAAQWGLAIRLAQRLSGGAVRPLADSRLVRDGAVLKLMLSGQSVTLGGEQVVKRLKQLAEALGLSAEMVVG
jgi:exopolyphosphatase / guanosine-5'-triphosphate,3'-diphosphate pyrophosphatase